MNLKSIIDRTILAVLILLLLSMLLTNQLALGHIIGAILFYRIFVKSTLNSIFGTEVKNGIKPSQPIDSWKTYDIKEGNYKVSLPQNPTHNPLVISDPKLPFNLVWDRILCKDNLGNSFSVTYCNSKMEDIDRENYQPWYEKDLEEIIFGKVIQNARYYFVYEYMTKTRKDNTYIHAREINVGGKRFNLAVLTKSPICEVKHQFFDSFEYLGNFKEAEDIVIK